jgi:hypothetical protein
MILDDGAACDALVFSFFEVIEKFLAQGGKS